MTENVLYTIRWNDITRRPAADHEWIGADSARTLAGEGEWLEAVDATEVDAEGLPVPRWVIGFQIPGRIRVIFYNRSTSVWRQIDWDLIDGRLWQWITVDYAYADDVQQWSEGDAVSSCYTKVNPDGSGWIRVLTRGPGPKRKVRARLSGRASSGRWVDLPDFGDWAELTRPGSSAYEVAGLKTSGIDALKELEAWPDVERGK